MDFIYWLRLIIVFLVIGFSIKVGMELAQNAINKLKKPQIQKVVLSEEIDTDYIQIQFIQSHVK